MFERRRRRRQDRMHQSPPPSSLPLSKHEGIKYRPTKPLPVDVLDHGTVCIEEQLYAQAFSLLASNVTAGNDDCHALRLPPPQHLAFAATLMVHPSLTTRTTATDKHAAADDALSYLKLVNELAGPQNAGLSQTFVFGAGDAGLSRSVKRSAKPRPSDAASNHGDDENQIGFIRSPLAKKQSVWMNAEDFWAVVGWAFNCSVAHPARWTRWRLWLDYVLDVLEDDLEIRVPAAMRAYEAGDGSTAAVRESLQDSLFARWLAPIGEGRNSKRRLMRAVLADGRKQALAEFGEVWKGETKGPKVKREQPVAKRRKLDLENGLFGDYFDDDSDRDSAGGDSSRRSRSTTAISASRQRSRAAHVNNDGSSDDELQKPTPSRQPPNTNPLAPFGGQQSLHLRKRLLALLARFCALNPDAFLDTEDLFDLYTEFLRPLPLPVFTSLILPATPWLGPHSHASLTQMLLRPLLAGAGAPAYGANALTARDFEAHFAPFAAGKAGAVENARVAVCVEALLRLLWTEGALESGRRAALRKAVEKGIRERRARCDGDGRRKAGSRAVEEDEALRVLEAGAERMRAVLDMADEG